MNEQMESIQRCRRDNLRKLAKQLGGARNLAEALGKSESRLSQMIGKNYAKPVGDKFARSAEAALEKPAGYLDRNHDRPEISFRRVPIVGDTELGPDPKWFEEEFPYDFGMGYVNLPAATESCYALKVVNNDYSPRMRVGEAILSSTVIPAEPGQDIILKFKDGSIKIVEYLYIENDTLWCNSLEGSRDRFGFPTKDLDFFHPIGAAARITGFIVDE